MRDMSASGSNQRRRVLYSGHVQGVGFRYTAVRVAQGFAVTGFVRNLRNGSVELVAEGEPAELDGFLAKVAATMGGCIDNVESQSEAAAGEFESFTIGY